jgi:hypothetical protein
MGVEQPFRRDVVVKPFPGLADDLRRSQEELSKTEHYDLDFLNSYSVAISAIEHVYAKLLRKL